MESDSLDTKKRFFKFCTSYSNRFPGNEGRYFGTPDIEEWALWLHEKQSLINISPSEAIIFEKLSAFFSSSG